MIRPTKLKKGDKIALIAPSRMIVEKQLDAAKEIFKSKGLEVILGSKLFNTYGYFAGSDEERLSDLQEMIDNPKIRAIFCARGGYGMSRILDQLNLNELKNNPKWIIGFSDITALHLQLNHLGIESIHGLMPVQYEYMGVEESLESLWQLLFEEKISYEIHGNSSNKEGSVKAQIIGGNLSLLIDSLGTKTEIDSNGKILFIEEIDEYLYKVDRMINHLKRAGKLNKIKGLIIGNFTELKDTRILFGQNLKEIILSHCQSLDVPICFNFPVGHESLNLAIPCGREVSLNVSKDKVSLIC